MKKMFFLLLIFAVFACENKPQKPVLPVGNSLNKNNNYEAIILKKWNQEYLSFDSILLNGTLPVVTTKENLYALLGKPDKILPITINRSNLYLMQMGEPKKAYYLIYGNTVFESFEDKVIVNTIDFESTNVELVHPKITLKKGMQGIDIQRVFPESGRLLGGSGGVRNLMISASKPNGGIQDVWFLIFTGEKLHRVVLYTVPTFENSAF